MARRLATRPPDVGGVLAGRGSGGSPRLDARDPSRGADGRDEAAPEGLFLATLRIRIPPGLWTAKFSNAHPHVRLEVLNRSDLNPSVSISDYWVSGNLPGAWANEISQYPDVVRLESLAQVGDGCLYRITYRNPPVIELYRRLKVPLQFPQWMQGGRINWEVAARRREFEEIMRYARRVDPALQVISIRRRPLRSHLPTLTERQHQLLTQAMAAGYFAVPRGITLTALARRLQRSKSSVSESIAIIEKKLLETAWQSPALSS